MSDTATQEAPAETVAPLGVKLDVVGVDGNGEASTTGMISPSLTIADPDGVFTFNPADDQLSATLVPTGKVGKATVSFAASADSGTLSAAWVGEVVPGPVVSVSITSTPIEAAPAPAPAPVLFTFSGDPASIDTTLWAKADVQTDTGLPLYTWTGSGEATTGTDWAEWTGATQPVPA
jgi:hypothetical protein